MLVTMYAILHIAFITTVLSVLGACTTTLPTPPKMVAELGVIGDVDEDMEKLWKLAAQQLQSKPAPDGGVGIVVPISSPGGAVDSMMSIFESMKAIKKLGYSLHCIATVASSAAFMIWMECDKRYVYRYSSLLFHYPQYGVQSRITYEKSKDMYHSLALSRVEWLSLLDRHLGSYFSTADLDKWALQEKRWMGDEFCDKAPGYCTILQ